MGLRMFPSPSVVHAKRRYNPNRNQEVGPVKALTTLNDRGLPRRHSQLVGKPESLPTN